MQSIGIVVALTLLGAILFLQGIHWGLPSRNVDPFLFGSHPVWSGDQILILIGTISDKRAADVSSRPLDRSHGPVTVNATDQDRARIVRRYRLMSYQPDEFATFAALSQMNPSRLRFDPRMYKYGGLWIYPVGAFLKLAGFVGFVHLNPDATYYLDHPEQFGRFYVVAHCYSVAWGLVGIAAIFLLIYRCCGSVPAAACGAFCFMFMPVVVTAAHEAKPHIAGAVLMLLAVLAAANFVEYGRRRSALLAAILCGAAIGMVPSACPVLAVLPGMLILRKLLWDGALKPSRILAGIFGWVAVSVLVYCLTNPYVLINLFRDRAVLQSDFENSSAFYHASLSVRSLVRGTTLIGLGSSFLLAGAGCVGAIELAVRASLVKRNSADERRRRAHGMLLAAATLPAALIFILFAAWQPDDFARFALTFDIFLAVEAVVAVATFVRTRAVRTVCFGILALTTAISGSFYLRGFIRDTSSQTTRLAAAADIRELLSVRRNSGALASREEPAPWSLPPVDLFRWKIIVPPRFREGESFHGASVTISPTSLYDIGLPSDFLTHTPISWAAKGFEILESRPGVETKGAANEPAGTLH